MNKDTMKEKINTVLGNIFRFIKRNLLKIIVGLVLLFVLLYVAIGWYFSNKLFAVQNQKVEYDQTIVSRESNALVISGSAYDVNGVMGIIKEGGVQAGITTKPANLEVPTKTSTRSLEKGNLSDFSANEKISLYGNIWNSNPKEALNINYENVIYKSEVGDMQAWFIPAANDPGSKKWTIAVHGVGASKTEMLRFIKPVVNTESNMLVISYRGDDDNPTSPDKRNHFGDSEWKDVESAVAYAKSKGAEEIQLYGTSLGGSLVQNYLRQSKDVSSTNITRVILDSPALDWNEILGYRTTKMGFPKFLAKPGMQMAKLRAGIDFNRATTKPGSIKHKTLIIHNFDDTSVPQAASKRVAEAQPDLVEFVDFGSGGHIRAWNNDQRKYESIVQAFLQK